LTETVKKPKAPAKAKKSTPAKAVKSKEPKTPLAPSPNEIADLAYTYWVERNYEHGHHDHDWNRAEKTLKKD
jgi:hypothetical protein